MKFLAQLALVTFLAVSPAHAEMAAAPAAPAATETVIAEKSYGQADAPITIVEYASLTCGHCAAFQRDVLPAVKKDLIETGQARLVYRDFPLDQWALKAAAVARCVPDDAYFPLLDTLFTQQQIWTKADDIQAALNALAVAAGLTAEKADACMNDEAQQLALTKIMQEAQQNFGINSTPSFIFFEGDKQVPSYPAFEKILQENYKDPHAGHAHE